MTLVVSTSWPKHQSETSWGTGYSGKTEGLPWKISLAGGNLRPSGYEPDDPSDFKSDMSTTPSRPI